MKQQIKIPAVGESITEGTISKWHKNSGDWIDQNQEILTVETDKAGVEVVAEHSGVLNIITPAGTVVAIGAVVGEIDTAAAKPAGATTAAAKPATPAANPATAQAPAMTAAAATATATPAAGSNWSPRNLERMVDNQIMSNPTSHSPAQSHATPASAAPAASAKATTTSSMRGQRRVPMTTIRKRIAERLVQAQHTAAILTTFNEIDMTNVMAVRDRYKDKFKEKYGTGLGFMGFFTKAVIEALKTYPQVNAYVDGTDFIYNDFYNIGIAVGTERGLMVPVIRDAGQMTIAEIELAIKGFAGKARDGKISIDDLKDGTFTISNGGVYGSLMSTPILNPPQSGILGMHKIEKRPVVIDDEIKIRPMMYVALSYDHRVIDGSESVSFLVRIKDCMEDPQRLLLEI
jgi:2-oxoglutarate dehydrogenase E2 component (dihydrolipoamide succinyltransferase)